MDRRGGEKLVGKIVNSKSDEQGRAQLIAKHARYRVIFKKVSFGIFRTIMVSKEEKIFTIKSKGKGLSLSKFS